MTVKDIAKAVGKSEASVHRWVEKTSRKMREVSRKVREAKSTSQPADYTLEETLAIIEEGLGPEASGVFRANAENQGQKATAQKKLPNGVQMGKLIEAVEKGLITKEHFQATLGLIPLPLQAPVTPQVAMIEPPPLQVWEDGSYLPGDTRFYTVQGFASLHKIKLHKGQSSQLGRLASKACAEEGIEPGSVPNAQYGEIRTYPEGILTFAFRDAGLLPERQRA